MALGVLAASGQFKLAVPMDEFEFLGELSLYGGMPPCAACFRRGRCTAALSVAAINRNCHLDATGGALLDQASARLGLSARGYHRIFKLARTIAALAGSPAIGAEHVAKAIGFHILAASPERRKRHFS